MGEDQINELVTVDQSDASARLLIGLGSVGPEAHEEAMIRRRQVAEKLGHGRATNAGGGALHLDLDDRRLKTELVAVGDDVDPTVGALPRHPRPVAHRTQEVRHEVRERVALQLLGEPACG